MQFQTKLNYMSKEKALEEFAATNPEKSETQLVTINNEPVVLMATPMAEDMFYDALEPVIKLLKALGINLDEDDWHELNQAVLGNLDSHFETLFLAEEF